MKPSETKDRYWLYAHRSISFCSDEDTGKWMIFLRMNELDKAWELISDATREGLLGPASKCSTALENPTQKDVESAVIVVYTNNYRNKKDLKRVENKIRQLGFNQKLFYKKCSTTAKGIYGPDSWYLQSDGPNPTSR